MYPLTDIFIGSFELAEFFGSNTPTWKARYNLQGCPGIIWKMPSLTPLLAANDGYVLETGMEEAGVGMGRGKYIILQHDGYQTAYGHMNDFAVKKDQKVIASQLIGHSNQSGLAEFPCLLFQVIPTDHLGNKTEQNGYDGAVDPRDENIVKWDIKGIKEPAIESDAETEFMITTQEYRVLEAQASNFRLFIKYLLDNNFNKWLKDHGLQPINLEANPGDNTIGQAIVIYFRDVYDEFSRLESLVTKKYKKDGVENKTVEEPKKTKINFFSRFRLFK